MPPLDKIYCAFYEPRHSQLEVYAFGWLEQKYVGDLAKSFLEKIVATKRFQKYADNDGEFWIDMRFVVEPKESYRNALEFIRFEESKVMEELPPAFVDFVRGYFQK